MSYIKKGSGTSFERFVAGTIANVPYLAILVIAGNYTMMGWATSALLQTLLSGVTSGVGIAWGVGVFASLGRGTLVFLPNFDPDKPDFSRRGEMVAIVFTALFLYEILHLVLENGLNPVVAVSFSILALMGCTLEILAVGNIKRKHNADIASDKERVRKYVNSMSAIANMEALEDEVKAAMSKDGQFFDKGDFMKYFGLEDANIQPAAMSTPAGMSSGFVLWLFNSGVASKDAFQDAAKLLEEGMSENEVKAEMQQRYGNITPQKLPLDLSANGNGRAHN